MIKPEGDPLSYVTPNEVITVVARDVANTSTPVFSYYDQTFAGSESPLTQPVSATAVRVVQIKLQLEENPTISPAPFNIEAKVEIRNLKTN